MDCPELAVKEDDSTPNILAGLEIAAQTIRTELSALGLLAKAIERKALRETFQAALRIMCTVKGRIIVTGVGKSGIIARKIAATFNSTGTPAQYMHGGDASHGDLGSITDADIVLLLSWSGESPELTNVIGYCRRFAIPLVVMTGRAQSAAGRAANVCLTLPKVQEACPHKLAPTSSTLIQLALGDALAMAMISFRTFSAHDFQHFHPGGRLGARLLIVESVMTVGEAIPQVISSTSVRDATVEMTSKRFGCTAVLDDGGRFVGVFSDGDLRRCLYEGMLTDDVSYHMSVLPITVAPKTLASDALRLMNDRRITTLFVCEDDRLAGVVHLHDLLHAGVA